MNCETLGESQGSGPNPGLLGIWPGLWVWVNTLSTPFQCAGPRPRMRRGAAELSVPGTSTDATPSAPSRRAPSPASAPCSESLARVMSRRPDSTTTSQAPGLHHPLPYLSGGSGGLSKCSLAGGSSPCSAPTAVKFGARHFPAVGLSVQVCVMGPEGGNEESVWRFPIALEFWES